MSVSVNLPLHHKVQKFSSGTSSPGWSREKGRGCGNAHDAQKFSSSSEQEELRGTSSDQEDLRELAKSRRS